ncbi:V-type ATP synthase subunit I [Xanthobacter sp. ZOL 2024]
MSIVPMRRLTLCGPLADKADTLKALQKLGVMHLIPLTEAAPLAPRDATRINRTQAAYRHLTEAPDKRLPYRPKTPFDLDVVVAEVLENRSLLRTLRDRRDVLQARIEALAPWGDIHFPPLEALAGQRLWFYALPIGQRAALDLVRLPWHVVRKGTTNLYVAVIAPEEPPDDLLPVPRVHVGAVPRSVLKVELDDNAIAIEKAENTRAELSRWRLALGTHLAAAADQEDLREAAEHTFDADAVFAVQGWVPARAVPEVAALAADGRLALVDEVPGPSDAPPTLLDIPKGLESGGDLTSFYTSPGYRSWDPSLVVFSSFALFFAMIVADAGYALLLALGTLAFWRRLGARPAGRRARVLLITLAGAALLYGVLAGSYFGLKPPAGSLPAALAIIHINDFDQMMQLSLIIGVVHLTVALGAVAWLNRDRGAGLSALGWIVTLWSGLAAFLAQGSGGEGLAYGAIALGLALVFVGAAAATPVEAPLDWLKRLAAGVLALTSVTKLFGDVLSYLRLFALGLASASLAATFNALAVEMRGTHPGLGVVLMIAILAFGHVTNIALGLMSGVVHGLRLNFIEFFGWGLTEEGYPFRAFARRELPQ